MACLYYALPIPIAYVGVKCKVFFIVIKIGWLWNGQCDIPKCNNNWQKTVWSNPQIARRHKAHIAFKTSTITNTN